MANGIKLKCFLLIVGMVKQKTNGKTPSKNNVFDKTLFLNNEEECFDDGYGYYVLNLSF